MDAQALLLLFEDRLVLLCIAIAINILLAAGVFLDGVPTLFKPARWCDRYAAAMQKRLNKPGRSAGKLRFRGGFVLLYILIWALIIGMALSWLFAHIPYGWVVEAAVLGFALGWRRAYDTAVWIADHCHDVSLDELRMRLDEVSPYDHRVLDLSGVYRITVERLVLRIAHLAGISFWYVALGLPGAAVYIAIIRSAAHMGAPSPALRAYGLMARNLYALAQWLPSLWAGVLIMMASLFSAGAKPFTSLSSWGRSSHIPAWQLPLMLVASKLDIQLGGKRQLAGRVIDHPWIGKGTPKITETHLRQMIMLYRVVGLCYILTVGIVYLLIEQY